MAPGRRTIHSSEWEGTQTLRRERHAHKWPSMVRGAMLARPKKRESFCPGPTVYTLVHPTSIPVGLTDTLIICLAAALASIDLMKSTIQQNNKRNITTTMPIIMPTLVNHCPQDPKSELNQSQVCMFAPAFLVTSSLRFFSFPIALVNDPSGAVLFGI